jgi:hypothetical protein
MDAQQRISAQGYQVSRGPQIAAPARAMRWSNPAAAREKIALLAALAR